MEEHDIIFARKQFTRVGLGLFGFLAGALAVQIVTIIAALLLAPSLLYEEWFNLLMGTVSVYGVGTGITVGIIRSGPKCVFQPVAKMGVKDLLLAFCVMYGITYVGSYIGNSLMGVAEVILQKEISNPVESIPGSGVAFWLEIVSVLILAPVLEELIFRKCIIDAVLPYGEGTAILLSAITFGFAHGNFFQFFYSAGAGALFAYIYIKTGKIRNTMILHGALNLFGGVIPLLMMDWSERITELSESGDIQQMLQGLSDMGIKAVVVMAFSYIMLGIAIAGIVVGIVHRKQFKINKATMPIPSDKWFVTVFANVGIILFFVIGTFIFISNLLG